MSLFSLIAVFLIEQVRPLDYPRWVEAPLNHWADFIESRFNAGEYAHGVIGWGLAVALPAFLALVLYIVCYAVHPLMAFGFNVAVLYLALGFRQFSHHYTEIQQALQGGDTARARQALEAWVGGSAGDLSSADVARVAIERAMLAAHRHVFAVLVAFVLLPGPLGAVLYRVACVVRERWGRGPAADINQFSIFSRQAFAVIDWLPARATAGAFAIVGNFEDAAHCWRTQGGRRENAADGIVLAAGAGALGVRLAPAAEENEKDDGAPSALGIGEPADADFMQSAVGLVWRATVLWVLVLFMLWLATLVG